MVWLGASSKLRIASTFAKLTRPRMHGTCSSHCFTARRWRAKGAERSKLLCTDTSEGQGVRART
eukprot:771269-Pelagomonas_calceolata.AAC.4